MLTVQGIGRKLNTPLLFPGRLDSRPFLSATVLRQRFAGRPRSAPAVDPGAAPEAVHGDYEIYAVVCHSGNLQARPASLCCEQISHASLGSRPSSGTLVWG